MEPSITKTVALSNFRPWLINCVLRSAGVYLKLCRPARLSLYYRKVASVEGKDKPVYTRSVTFLEDLAIFLKPSQSSQLSRYSQTNQLNIL